MSLVHRIFKRNRVDCPRCLGKGVVDDNDIKRLNKELFWDSGRCAYCNGAKKVSPDLIKKVSPDTEYLTTDLSSRERKNVIDGGKNARERATEHKEAILEYIKEIEDLYYIENKEVDTIADIFIRRQKIYGLTTFSKQDFVSSIEKVLRSKRGQ